jgi:hypothetical protein
MIPTARRTNGTAVKYERECGQSNSTWNEPCRGSVQRRAEKTKTQSHNPSWFESSCHSLPETHENSNYILLRILIEISNSARGEKAIAVAQGPLHRSLPLSPAAITRLQDVRLIRLPRSVQAKRLPIDYAALQQSFARMLTEGGFSSRAELAQHLGVSRVWVSRVLKDIKKKTV